jgi:hypothetical protein
MNSNNKSPSTHFHERDHSPGTYPKIGQLYPLKVMSMDDGLGEANA